MKLQVPLRMPSMRSMRSPASPCSSPGITGIPPATAAPYFRCPPLCRRQPLQFDPVERNQLLVGRDHALAGIEGAPYPGARRIEPAHQFHNHIGIGARTASASSLHTTAGAVQSTRLRATLRLKTCVNSSPSGFDSDRMRATELPTVPNPKMATRSGRSPCAFCADDGAADTLTSDKVLSSQ